MINAHCRKFLKFLRNNCPDYDDEVFTYSWISENYKEPLNSVFAMVRFLEEQGYLKIATGNGNPFGIVLTELALHPHQFGVEKLKKFLLTSIFTPVAVSVITTLLTLWLKELL